MEYDPAADSLGCYDLVMALRREELVRSGQAPPSNDAERRQAAEGLIPKHEYDAAKERRVNA